MIKALCCCLKKSKKPIQEPLIKIEDVYDDGQPKYRSFSDIVEKTVNWSIYEEPESKEDYYRMLGEAALLKQKLIGKL